MKVRQWQAQNKGIERNAYAERFWEYKAFGTALDELDAPEAEAWILMESIINLYKDHRSNK